MRNLSAVFQQHLASGATTTCNCWRLTRHDGLALGFTDHDRSVSFDGSTFEPGTGLTAARAESQLGFGVGGTEVSGVLSSPSLDAASLGNGLYDGAKVETWLVNWHDPEQRVLLESATTGEIRRSEHAFTAELRSGAHALDQERGRLYQSACSAELGDNACLVILNDARYRAGGQVLELLSTGALRVDVTGFENDWFSRGQLDFLSGQNAGSVHTVESFRLDSGVARVTLWTPPAAPVAVSDQIRLTAGCDKTFATCRNKFSNHVNFRGFPHIPGNDALLTHPGTGAGSMDGGSLFKQAPL